MESTRSGKRLCATSRLSEVSNSSNIGLINDGPFSSFRGRQRLLSEFREEIQLCLFAITLSQKLQTRPRFMPHDIHQFRQSSPLSSMEASSLCHLIDFTRRLRIAMREEVDNSVGNCHGQVSFGKIEIQANHPPVVWSA